MSRRPIDIALLAAAAHTAAYFLSTFFRTANAVISEMLTAEFALSATGLGFMTSLFYFAVAAVQIPVGIALDRLGPRRVVPASLLIAAVGCVAFASAQSLAALAASRTLLGAGMGAVLMGGAKTLSLVYSAERYPGAFGMLVGIGTAGGLVSASPLRFFAESVGWRGAFLIGAGAIVAVAAAVAAVTPSVRRPANGHERIASAMKRIVANRAFVSIAVLNFFTAGALLSIRALWADPYLAVVHGTGGTGVGAALTVATAGMIIGYPIFGRIARAVGVTRMIVPACIAFVSCLVAFAAVPASTPYPLLVVLYLLFGFTGSAGVHLITQAIEVFPRSQTGQAITLVNVVAIGGSFLLQWLFGVAVELIADFSGSPALGYRISFASIALLGVIALAVYAPLAARSTPAQKPIPRRPHTPR